MPGRLHTIASQCSNQRKRTADGWVVSPQQGETPLRYPGYLSTLAGCRERERGCSDRHCLALCLSARYVKRTSDYRRSSYTI